MPFFYGVVPAVNFTTSGTANTEVDALFIKPGTRDVSIQTVNVIGKGAGLTAISGIAQRIKKWTSTASSGGSAITPSPRDPGAQASKATAGQASGGVTPGTGGPVYQCSFGSGAASPGFWNAYLPDQVITLEGSANQSMDVFNISGTISLVFELSVDIFE